MKAVIMAGGKGTRLRPLTCNRPKPMVPLGNRPMMEHIAVLLKQHHFNEVMATLFYLPEAIREYFGDGSRWGMSFRYFIEETPLGTAGSVKNGEAFLNETFLVISGDTLTDIDLGAAVRFHREKGAAATLVLTKVSNPLEYGVVITDQEGRIRRFLEKPGWGEVFSDTVNTGIYILEPKIFDYFEKGQVFDFSKDLFPKLLAGGEPLYGFVAPGYWSDIGNLEQYRQAHYDILTGQARVSLPGQEIRPGVWAGEGTVIAPDAVIEAPVLLGAGCRVEARAHLGELTVIGNDAQIQEGTSIKRGVLWDHCYLGQNCEVRGAILCHHSYLKGRNALYEGAVLGEGVSLGTRATVRPQVKIWPDKEIDSGSVLHESLIWAKKSSRSLFGNSGISGTVNQELTPEVVVKLGAVYGAALKPGASLVVSCDDYRPARVFKRALVAGVLAAGVGVYDLGTQATPVTRYALVSLGAHGGVHLGMNPRDPDGILMEFFDKQGLNIDKNCERALENAFFSEDFPRAAAAALGELTFVPQLIEPYLNELIDREHKELIRKARFKVVTDYDRGSLGLILPGLLSQMECEAIRIEKPAGPAVGPAADGVPRPRILGEILNALGKVSDQVLASGADLGILVDHNAERLILVDEKGTILKEEELTMLLSYYVLKYRPTAMIPVPVTAPRVIEELAREFHGRVIRTKANPRSLMEKVAQERLFPAEDGKHALDPHFDALFCLVKILELLAREGLTLSEAKALAPPLERSYQEALCPWEEKGRVMRNLFEENKDRELEMTDGLKVFHEEGWALVLPDAEEPVFRIYAEANTAEEADALAHMYLNRIGELQVH